ncbi:MAG: hypothetical protein H6573_29180 [Lewinellaceae bacterium]|nr:hypothetical protein [Lewinellaceae bacterium]
MNRLVLKFLDPFVHDEVLSQLLDRFLRYQLEEFRSQYPERHSLMEELALF